MRTTFTTQVDDHSQYRCHIHPARAAGSISQDIRRSWIPLFVSSVKS
jgi:hypothetical protein